ncbi:MAG: DUF5683 domain-containing protein [Bacteroidota bacterium]
MAVFLNMKYLFLSLGLLLAGSVFAQIPDSVKQADQQEVAPPPVLSTPPAPYTADSLSVAQVDTSSKRKKKGFFKNLFDKSDYPNPKKAFILSGIVPGAGQIYNKKLWYIKVPIIYGGMGSMMAIIIFNSRLARRLKVANQQRFDGDDDTVDEFVDRLDDQSLRRNWNSVRKNRELSYVGLIVMHILQSAEAFVQAHLLEFDVSDDLSLNWSPQIINDPFVGPQAGIGIQLNLKPPKQTYLRPLITP